MYKLLKLVYCGIKSHSLLMFRHVIRWIQVSQCSGCVVFRALIFAKPLKTIIKIVLQIFNGQLSLKLPEGLSITLVANVVLIQIL